MKKIIIHIGFLLTLVFFLPLVFGQIKAASLDFSPTTTTTSVNQTFQLSVTINPGSDQIAGTDSYVTFDGTVLEAQSISAGSYFPVVQNTITSGRVYIAGMVDDGASYKTGSGTVATITFKGLKDGSVSVTFDCGSSTIVKNDANVTNVLQCSENGSASVTVGTGSTSTGGDADQTTPLPTQLPKSGIIDNVVKWAVPGTILVILGIVAKVIL